MPPPHVKPTVLLGEVLVTYLQQEHADSQQRTQSSTALTALLQQAIDDIYLVTGTYPAIGDRVELGVAGQAQRFYFVRARHLRMRSGAVTGFDIIIDA